MGKISVLFVLWSIGTIILICVPQKSECLDPKTAIKVAMSVLSPLHVSTATWLICVQRVKLRKLKFDCRSKDEWLWSLFRVIGHAGGHVSGLFPRVEKLQVRPRKLNKAQQPTCFSKYSFSPLHLNFLGCLKNMLTFKIVNFNLINVI